MEVDKLLYKLECEQELTDEEYLDALVKDLCELEELKVEWFSVKGEKE